MTGLEPAPDRHVVLVGAGHANLLIVRGARRLRRRGIAVTLVDPDAFWYSGMAAAVAGGVVHPGRDRVDPRPLALSRDVMVRRARAVGLDGTRRVVALDDGSELAASAVVLNVGSEVDTRGLPTDLPGVTPVKPLAGLIALRDALAAGAASPRVLVVGGGASAVELAANLAAGRVARLVAPRVTIVGPSPLVPRLPPDARTWLRGALRRRGVGHVAARVEGLAHRSGRLVATTDAGHDLIGDHVVLATGLRASPAVRALGVGDARGMPTTSTLQHPEHPWLFGAGDAIRFGGAGLPRLGVFAVRQAPVIVHNLLALHGHGQLRDHRPRASWVSALDLGGGEALVVRDQRWFGGRSALAVKRVLDEWFLRRHRVPLGASGRAWGRPVG